MIGSRFNGRATAALHDRRASAENVDRGVHVRMRGVSAMTTGERSLALAARAVCELLRISPAGGDAGLERVARAIEARRFGEEYELVKITPLGRELARAAIAAMQVGKD